MNKRYWLRGLGVGIVFYAFVLLSIYTAIPPRPDVYYSLNPVLSPRGTIVIAMFEFFWIILLSWLLGWLYGKIKNRNKVV